MIECGSLEFAGARAQARHGQRLGEADWRRIEVVRELPAMLELARTTALRPWLVGVTADSPPARLEAALRSQFRALVGEVRGWMPGGWQASLSWCALLPDLAPLQHLARGGEPPRWMSEDEAWRELCAAVPAERRAVLARTPWAALAAAWDRPQALGGAWLVEWQRRLPRLSTRATESLALLVRILREHAGVFAGAAAGQGWPLRSTLALRLSVLLRRSGLEPAAVFIHIALSALDLERLRAELLRRALFKRWQVA